MKPESRKWINAAIVLGRDPAARVRCPVCDDADLEVRDVYPSPSSDVFERYLQCPKCHAVNIMRMKRPTTPPS